jgi:cell division protein ZapA (FtsZ GTPase activity inhibitor)
MAETISVQIHGTEYKLRGEDAARVREAADLVNEQMRFVAGKAPTQPTTTIAVLAALNTAELLKSEQERGAREAADIVRRINAISSSIRELIDLDGGDSGDVQVQSPAP